MRHLSDIELEMYRTGRLPFFRKHLCRLHLFFCADCGKTRKEMESDSELIREVRSARRELELPPDEKQLRILSGIFRNGSTASPQ